MAGNKSLKNAKKQKKDEFYTQISDIENELKHYKENFKNKIVFCNCDDPAYSNFWKYFDLNFDTLGLKKLISTHYEISGPSYKLELYRDTKGRHVIKTDLLENGDFRSQECIDILKESDIVVTNPPFSLFREYVAQLIEYDKKFVIIGHQNAITYKEIFALIKDNKLWLGYGFKGNAAYFITEHYTDYASASNHKEGMIRVSGVTWYTNIEIDKRYENIILYKSYSKENYPMYENYNAINIDNTKDIPFDYDGVMGVPITFMGKYNPEQFEIIALGITGSCDFTSNRKMEIFKKGEPTGKFTKNAKGTLYRKYNPDKDKQPAFKDVESGELYASIYARVLIKRNRKDKLI